MKEMLVLLTALIIRENNRDNNDVVQITNGVVAAALVATVMRA